MDRPRKSRPRRDRRLHLLLELAEVTASSVERDELLKRFVRWVVHAVPAADGAAVYLYHPAEACLVPAAWLGVKGRPFRKLRLASGEGISGLAFQNRMRFAIENPEDPQAVHLFGEGLSDENARHLQEAQGCILPRGIVSFPLQPRGPLNGSLLGVLSTWSHENPLEAQALELLEFAISPLTLALLRLAGAPSDGSPLAHASPCTCGDASPVSRDA